MQLSHELQVYVFLLSQGIQLKLSDKSNWMYSHKSGYFFIGENNDYYEGIYNEDKQRITMHNGKPFKTYNVMHNVGNVKYIVNYHDGFKKHEDGSKFYDMRTFKSIKRLNEFTFELMEKGYFQQP